MSDGKGNQKARGRVLDLGKPDTASIDRERARQMLRPTVGAAVTVQEFNKLAGELPLTELVQELTEQVRICANGDLARGEAMLLAQAHSLDAISNDLFRRGAANAAAGYMNAAETYIRLGLKAQSQCRSTIEALANIKNPRPVAYVQQANIGNAVQVNNQGAATTTENPPNKLLEVQRNEWMEREAASTSVFADQELETVGAVNRATDSQG